MKHRYPKVHILFHEIEDLSKIVEWAKRRVGIYLTESKEMYWGGQKVMRSHFVISTKQSEFLYKLQFPTFKHTEFYHSVCRNNPWD